MKAESELMPERAIPAKRLLEISEDPYCAKPDEIRWLIESLGDRSALYRAARRAPKQKVVVKWRRFVVHEGLGLLQDVLDASVQARAMQAVFYREPCQSCGKNIPRSGRQGRQPRLCEECR